MPNRKDWQPEDTQVETAAMALRAQQMRLWNLVEDSATSAAAGSRLSSG